VVKFYAVTLKARAPRQSMMTLGKTTLAIITLGIKTLATKTLGIKTLSIKILGKETVTFSIKTLKKRHSA